MKDVFFFPRFMFLLQRNWAIGQRAWMKMFFIMAAIMTAVLFGILNLMYFQNNSISAFAIREIFEQMTVGTLIGSLTIGSGISASMAFDVFRERGSGIAFLMLPATRFEKWLAAMLPSLVSFSAAAFLALTVGAAVSATAFNAMRPIQIPMDAMWAFIQPENLLKAFKYLMFTHAAYFLGAIWFRSNHWINVTAWVIGALIVAGVAIELSWQWSLGEAVKAQNDAGQWFVHVEREGLFRLPVSPIWNAIKNASLIATPLFLWTLSYIRFCEKEI